jgi:hypothetical protein
MPQSLALPITWIAMFILPGWAILTINSLWRQWATLQRWCLAIVISVACYPVLFYGLRAVLPAFTLGPYKMTALLVICAAVIVWRLRHTWREQFRFDALEWVAIAIVGMTVFSRFWIIRNEPYPAWTDSLHHAILTQLTAVQGGLPYDMQPYFPIPLGEYHLGLYALSATVEWLAQVPAHVALLGTAQLLNGLCGLGVYLVLDRKAGRVAALVGAAIAGLFSPLPNFYVNWGRFTQLSSATVLLTAWLITWEVIRSWKARLPGNRPRLATMTLMASLLNAAVFLFHFRMAGFYLPLIAITLIYELLRERNRISLLGTLGGIVAVGAISFLCVLPALLPAMSEYLRHQTTTSQQAIGLTSDDLGQIRSTYYEMPLSIAPTLSVGAPLLIAATVGSIWGVLRRRKLTILFVLWMVCLVLLGEAYLLNIPVLNLSNLSGILIMFYLPVAVVIGAAVQDMFSLVSQDQQPYVLRAGVASLLATGFVCSFYRGEDIQPSRYFAGPADEHAMAWIQANTPPNAVFAINSLFWMPGLPHGTDAGYWIPYFTGRQTTTSCMIMGLASPEYVRHILEMSRTVRQLVEGRVTPAQLRKQGIDYIFVGALGNFSGSGLNAQKIVAAPGASGVELVYDYQGTQILRIK